MEKSCRKVMSILNLGLQCVGLMRKKMSKEFEQVLKQCNSIKDIRNATKNYPNLQQELNNSLQLVKDLLNSIFARQSLKTELFTTVNAATTEEIDQIFDAILELDQTMLKTDKTWKTIENKTKFKTFFEHCCQSRHYFFSIKK